MSIVKLDTQHFRNLKETAVEFHPTLNAIVGDNGSGKSSILEAIFYLAHAKSFRTTQATKLVTIDNQQFVISMLDDENNRLGISKNTSTNETLIKINGERCKKLSLLAQRLAVQIVTPESFKLFFGGPKERRKFLDLGMFHVKHEFMQLWKNFSKVLKQRNACLKSQSPNQQLAYWTEPFIQLSEEIAQLRNGFVEELVNELNVWTQLLLPSLDDEIRVQYLRGWSQTKSLQDVLKQNYQKEVQQGFSAAGSHKFDIRFNYNGVSVDQTFSRGQQKLFLLALTFAQTSLISKVNRVKPILLIDDFGAELDNDSRTLLANAIEKINCQVILSAIEKKSLDSLFLNKKELKMFHVEHGKLSAMNE